jgi:hypothetical protein
VARIGRQLAARPDQQHVHGLAQACEFALIVEYDRLDSGALGNQSQQPRFAAAGVGLDKKSGVDQRREIEFQPPASEHLSDDHRLFPANRNITAGAIC